MRQLVAQNNQQEHLWVWSDSVGGATMCGTEGPNTVMKVDGRSGVETVGITVADWGPGSR